MNRSSPPKRVRPTLEPLEDRAVPALISGQQTLRPPILDRFEVEALLRRAAAATASDDAIIAVVDRGGRILGVAVESGVSTAITGDMDQLIFAIDGAVAKARTAGFFANDTAPLTSRTIQFISQTTMTQREIESDPSITDPNSTVRGPGFVAPIGIKGHFPPGVAFTPQVDLFAIEHTNRDSILHPGRDHIKGTADDRVLSGRFNINPAFVPAGKELTPPFSFGEARLSEADRRNPALNHYQARGIATLPGGIPIYQYGTLIGGIGVFFPGETGFANEENSSLSADHDPTQPDRTLEAEFMALAAAGGSAALGLPVGTLGGIPKPAGFDIPDGRIDLVGITLDVIGPGGDLGPGRLVAYANANLGVNMGSSTAVTFHDVDADPTNPFLRGRTVPDGWLVAPHAGRGISADDVRRIIMQGVNEANLVRAQIRLPRDERTRMVLAVADSRGEILGLFRMPDSTVFSIDVAVAKARNTAYYNDPAALQEADRVSGVRRGTAFTNRTFRYLAHPRFPISVEGTPPAPFSILNDPGTDPRTGLNVGPPRPASVFMQAGTSVQGYDAFNVGSNFRHTARVFNQNGIVFFPGSSGVYKRSTAGATLIVGGFGVSGDGVDQDDVVTHFGIQGYRPPAAIRIDQIKVGGVRLPYLKFPRNPER
jgi:uncharacterized protein GlcG (DUF336 family)